MSVKVKYDMQDILVIVASVSKYYGLCQLENACPSNVTYVSLTSRDVSSHGVLTENEQVEKKCTMHKIKFPRPWEMYLFRNVMRDPLLLATLCSGESACYLK